MNRSDGWSMWALAIFVLATIALIALGVSVAFNARQYGTLLLGLIGAVVGAFFLLETPGWSRKGRD